MNEIENKKELSKALMLMGAGFVAPGFLTLMDLSSKVSGVAQIVFGGIIWLYVCHIWPSKNR